MSSPDMTAPSRGKRRGLVVEDDPKVAELLRRSLQNEDLEVDICSLGKAGIDACKETRPDIILLDYELPDLNGRAVCREIRQFSDAYIVMVTAHDSEANRVASLELGADDFIAKPFSPVELGARINAMLRRPRMSAWTREELVIGDLRLIREPGTASIDKTPVNLTTFEFKIVELLALRSPHAMTRHELINKAWNGDHSASHAIDVHMHNIRRKLLNAGMKRTRIQTIRAVGYRMTTDNDVLVDLNDAPSSQGMSEINS